MTPDEYCQQKAAASGSSFYYSFRFLPPPRRRGITALYAFCREVDDVVDELGSRREVEYVRRILAEGTSAERQAQIYRDTGDLRNVVRAVVDETRDGIEQTARTYRV